MNGGSLQWLPNPPSLVMGGLLLHEPTVLRGNYNWSQQPFQCRIHVNTFILSALLQTCRPFMWKSEPALRKDYRIPKVKHRLTWSLFHQEVDSQDESLLFEKVYCQFVFKSITFQMGPPLRRFTQTLSLWLRCHRLCVLKPADDTDAYCYI